MVATVSTGPYGTPPEIPGYPGPASPPPTDAPPPYWQAPAPPPRPPRSLGPIIAAAVIALVLIGSIVGYVVIGLAYAQSRLDSEGTAYKAVVDHLNTLTDTVNSLKTVDTTSAASSTAASLQQGRTVVDKVVSSSQTAQSQISTDDASLASADASLKQNQWLTPLSRSRLDHASARIAHLRAALAAAKSITADYVQIGTFFQSFFDTLVDLDTLGTKSQATDLTGSAAADASLKTDVAKAIQLDKAPGLPAEMDSVLVQIQSLATDFAALVNAVGRSDSAGAQSAVAAVEADSTKLQAADFTGIGNQIDSFFQPLIDRYNSEVDKANQA